ncbi:MAG: 30S ribosomal protein S8 [Elusimicrobia bacterium]|nr:30S ribosomal protein S8 [Elusimicrobiota bacterium]MBU2614368.1 30S ribosomal protein S8 [Elusimicrobiota bacterium]
MSSDLIADMIAMINNAQIKYLEKIDAPSSKIKEEICKILKEEGYIASYKKIENYKQGLLRIYFEYGQNKERTITEIKRKSKPGLRVYRKWNEIPKIYRGLGISIVSTSKGLMTDRDARKKHLGGEIICTVW